MLSLNERIHLRDKLYLKLYNWDIIIESFKGIKTLPRKRLYKFLYNNNDINILYNSYISEFRTEEEAIYCLLHNDDYTNHKCPVCGNQCTFYNNKHGYRLTCGTVKCNQKLAHSPEAKQKAIDTNRKNRGCDYPTQDPSVVQKCKDTKKDRYGDENYNNREKAEATCQLLYDNPHYNNIEKMIETIRN